MFNKFLAAIAFYCFSISAFAYKSTGLNGVDEPLDNGTKIGMGLLFLIGTIAIVKGIAELANDKKNGKAVGGVLIGIGVLAFGIMGIWTSKMSGFSF
jgi:hypothetical protein